MSHFERPLGIPAVRGESQATLVEAVWQIFAQLPCNNNICPCGRTLEEQRECFCAKVASLCSCSTRHCSNILKLEHIHHRCCYASCCPHFHSYSYSTPHPTRSNSALPTTAAVTFTMATRLLALQPFRSFRNLCGLWSLHFGF